MTELEQAVIAAARALIATDWPNQTITHPSLLDFLQGGFTRQPQKTLTDTMNRWIELQDALAKLDKESPR